MDRRQITNYVNLTALILYIAGRVIPMATLSWIGLGIMTLSSIWTIIGRRTTRCRIISLWPSSYWSDSPSSDYKTFVSD